MKNGVYMFTNDVYIKYLYGVLEDVKNEKYFLDITMLIKRTQKKLRQNLQIIC